MVGAPMHALRTLAITLCLTLLAAPALSQNAPPTAKKPAPAAATTASAADKAAMNQTVDALIALLDGYSKRSRLDSMDALHKAGFSYEKHLLAPTNIDLSCKTPDERNVVAGMRSVDWDYALFFGQPAEVGRVCILPYKGKDKRTIASAPLADKEWKTVKDNPAGPKARDILMQRSADFQRRLLEEARKNPEALEALGARLYGATLQSLYITSILVLAAQESDSLDYLKKLHKGTFTRQNKVFQLLLRNKHFGDKEHNHERAALVGQVLALLEQPVTGKDARLKRLEEVLHIVQPERDRYLSPCPPKAREKRKK